MSKEATFSSASMDGHAGDFRCEFCGDSDSVNILILQR
jgi:hypothetical protein